MFKGTKPAGQPRTARTNAESQADPSNFPADLPYNAQGGLPASYPGGTQSYEDRAAEVSSHPVVGRSEAPAPFVITRAKK